MRKTTTAAAVVGAMLLGAGGAVAVGGAPAVQPGQTLSSYMGADQAQWDKVQTWIESEYGQGANPTPTTTPATAPSPTPTPTPTATTAPQPAGDYTNGSGGAKEYRTFQSYSNGTVNGQYHVDASGLDWSKRVGVMVYMDGSGDWGLRNPGSSYLMAGDAGIRAAAKRHNMILVTPIAPGTGCGDGDGSCWYMPSSGWDPNAKATWARDLVKTQIYGKFNVDRERVAIGGYSSGAQATTQFVGPAHADELMTDGVAVAISYGGAPTATSWRSPIRYGAEFKANVPFVWNTGTSDYAYTTTDGYGVKAGRDWYRNNGFVTELQTVSGGHDRSGDFGGVMSAAIAKHVKPA